MTPPRLRQKNVLLKMILPIVVILILVLGGLSIIQSQFGRRTMELEEYNEIRVGSILPAFLLNPIGDLPVPISELKAKLFFINFWATWCEACMNEMPSIVNLRNTFKNRGLEVIAINLDENPEGVVPKVKRNFNIDFPLYKDPEGKVADLFDVHAIPLTVILDKERRVLLLKDGEQDWSSPTFIAQLERWLSG